MEATQSNETWAMDFVQDLLVTDRKIRVLTFMNTFSRFSPATDPRFNYRSEDVVRTLERIYGKIGYPKSISVDQGSEFVSRDLDFGPLSMASFWTSPAQESLKTTPSSRALTESSVQSV